MKKILFCSAFAVLISGLGLAQTNPPAAVDGWGKVKWGMTIAQVAALYPEALISQNSKMGGEVCTPEEMKQQCLVMLLKVGDLDMSIGFHVLKGTSKINSVNLVVHQAEKTSYTNSYLTREDAFKQLSDSLTLKYGTPISQNDDKNKEVGTNTGVYGKVRWVLPSTVIELSWVEVEAVGYGNVHLTYTAVDKSVGDLL